MSSRLRAQYDGSLSNDKDNMSSHAPDGGSLAWSGHWSEASNSRVQLGQSRNTYDTRPSFYRTETTLRNLLLQHELRVAALQRVAARLERREDRLHNPATSAAGRDLDGRRSQDAPALAWLGDFGAQALQLHARRDRDSEFGGRSTGSLAWGWRFAPRWRLSASAATSFRASTLYQRFSEYGVAGLVPERGRNVEVGLRWSAGGSELGATLWRNRVDNLIAFGAAGACASSFGCYANVARARYEGVTLAGRHDWGGVALRASIDWHDPRNPDTDKRLARRAQRLATFGAETTLAAWTLGVQAKAAGVRFDDAANNRRLSGYGIVVGRMLIPGLALEGRVDNLGEKAYELARTYATPGRNAQLALRWTR